MRLNGTASATIWADDVTTTGAIESVYAVITEPESNRGEAGCAGSTIEILELENTGERFEANYNGFDSVGEYDVAIITLDTDGVISFPAETRIIQESNVTSAPDEFEDDDISESASFQALDGPSQSHTFHDMGDVDWVQFFALSNQIVTLETLNLGSQSDTLLELYDTDQATLLASNDDRGPSDLSSFILYTIVTDGFYFIRVRQADVALFGEASIYELRVFRETGPENPGGIAGVVSDQLTTDPAANATVTRIRNGVTRSAAMTNAKGAYQMWGIDSGSNYSVTVSKEGYTNTSLAGLTIFASNLTSTDISLVPSGAEGEGEGEGEPPMTCFSSGANSTPIGFVGLSGELHVLGLFAVVVTVGRRGRYS